MSSPFGIDGTPTVWNTKDGAKRYPANAFEDEGDHLNAIPWAHAYLHEGIRFFVSHRDQSLANGGTVDMVAEMGPTLNAHLIGEVSVGGDFLIDVYEGATVAADGTLLPIKNHNREVEAVSGVTPEAVLRLDPTITDVGSLLWQGIIFGGAGGRAVGTSGGGREEFIMARNVKYLLRFTNVSGQARGVSVELDWYQHDPVGTGVT